MVTRGQTRKEDKEPSWALTFCSSLSREGSQPLAELLSILFIPYTHSPILHKLSPRSTKSCLVCLHTMCLPQTQNQFLQKGTARFLLSTSTSKVACNTQLSAPPATYFYHPNISEHLR